MCTTNTWRDALSHFTVGQAHSEQLLNCWTEIRLRKRNGYASNHKQRLFWQKRKQPESTVVRMLLCKIQLLVLLLLRINHTAQFVSDSHFHPKVPYEGWSPGMKSTCFWLSMKVCFFDEWEWFSSLMSYAQRIEVVRCFPWSAGSLAL